MRGVKAWSVAAVADFRKTAGGMLRELEPPK